ncbi:MAG TPA: putative baseplate assembly protein [Kofleriaceae bacterium]
MIVKKKPDAVKMASTVDDLLSTTAGRDAFLDQEVQELVPDSWAVLLGPPGYRTYAIVDVTSGTRADFTLSAKTSGIDVASVAVQGTSASRTLDGVSLYDPPNKPDELELRKTVAFVGSKAQVLAPMPYAEPIEDAKNQRGASSITLDRMVLGLSVGRAVMVTGIEAGDSLAASTGVQRWEVAILDRITHGAGRTTLYFAEPLAYRYVRAGCTINANVVLASHGESVAPEVLGSGDAAQANQAFVLRKSPLTYVPAANASGAASTLDVRVNGVQWREVTSLYEQRPNTQAYVTRRAEDGSSTIYFGDGRHGARLPSGQENVVARYRTGIGPDGNVRARSLSLLLNPPLGVRSAQNPIAASGGAAPEELADARHNAPLKVLTLDRVVSLTDFEDFARGFAGIGKAHAQAIWSGDRRVIYLSAADASGKELDRTLPLYTTLSTALAQLSDGTDEIQIGAEEPGTGKLRTFIERRFRITAEVHVNSAYVAADVKTAVEAALQTAFAFEVRELAQHVSEADVIRVIQAVPGVVYTRLTRLGDQSTPLLPKDGVLVARNAEWVTAAGKRWIRPAELLLVNPTGIEVIV